MGTSSVAFDFLIISCQTYFNNLLRFNYYTSNFRFPKKYIFCKQQKAIVMGSLVSVIRFILKNDDRFKDIAKFCTARCSLKYYNFTSTQKKVNLHGFSSLKYLVLRYLGSNHFSLDAHKYLRKISVSIR